LIHRAALIAACLFLSACATSPLDTSGVESTATPSETVGAFPAHRGARVQWGGRIVSVTNEADSTLVEVLSYPLGMDGMPNPYRRSSGRFILSRRGFLEPGDYSPGRLVTAVGTVEALMKTSVGENEILLPRLAAEQLKLWAGKYSYPDEPRFGFGVGISIGL